MRPSKLERSMGLWMATAPVVRTTCSRAAYERNVDTDTRLRRERIQVITIAGFELGRGRGGPRCISCPIERDALPRSLRGDS